MKRIFFGIQLPETVRQTLVSKLEWMEDYRAFLKIVPPANLHLTLKFLGAVADDRLDEIMAKLKDAFSRIQSFRPSLSGWGTFPDRRPAVLWAGLAPESFFSPVYEQSEKFFESMGYARENRPFKAHITVARTGRIYPPEDFFKRWQALEALEHHSFAVSQVTLFESMQGGAAPVYRSLANFSLDAA